MGIKFSNECPAWLKALMENVVGLITPLDFVGELGFCYLNPEDKSNNTGKWVIAVYVLAYEVAGGGRDGANLLPEFSIDMLGLYGSFSAVSSFEWRVKRNYLDGLEGPEVYVEGSCKSGQEVQFHFYSDPPEGEKPSIVLDSTTSVPRFKNS